MATYSKTANGRPHLPTSYSFGPSTNQTSSSIYEGYLFEPSDHSSPEDRWTSAQPIESLVSQPDLYKEIEKQRANGKTALEEFCGPRVDDAKRRMINKLIKERTNSESGSTYTLAAINIDSDHVSDEEAKSGTTSLRDPKSEKKDIQKQSKKTAPILIVLQRSVNPYRNGLSIDLSQNFNSNLASDSIRPATSWTAPSSSTLLPYVSLSYNNVNPNAHGSDRSSTPQQVYQRSDDTRVERSSSVTSSDTASSSSLITPMSATSNKDCFITANHANGHNGPQVLTPLSAYPWSGISTPTESTKEGVLPQNTHKQQPAKVQQPTHATGSVWPLVMSSSSQTDISISDPCKDGRYERLEIFKDGDGGMRPPSTANHGPESGSVLSRSTREDHKISTKGLPDEGNSPLPSQVPRSKSPDIPERKPSWMDKMVPVIPSPAEIEPIEALVEEIKAESLVAKDHNPKPSTKRDKEHHNAMKSYELEQQETSHRRPKCDESSAALPKLATEAIQASGNNAETKERKSLSPQYNKTAEYIDSLSGTSAQGAANEARNRPPPLSRPVSYNERYLPASYRARYPPPSLGKPRSYERLRPTDHTSEQSRQPIKLQERYNDSNRGATDKESRHISTSAWVSSLGKGQSFERPHNDNHPVAGVPQPAGIRKIYKVKTDDEPGKAPNKHVKFSQPLASSSSVIACDESDITCPDPRPSSPRTLLAGEPTESPHTTSRATSRPSLPRQSSYIPTHSSDGRASHHSSSKDNSNKQSSTSTRREGKSSDRKRGKGNDSYNNYKPQDNSDGEEKVTKTVWSCPYGKCNRVNGYTFATHKELEKHKYVAHKRDVSGRK